MASRRASTLAGSFGPPLCGAEPRAAERSEGAHGACPRPARPLFIPAPAPPQARACAEAAAAGLDPYTVPCPSPCCRRHEKDCCMHSSELDVRVVRLFVRALYILAQCPPVVCYAWQYTPSLWQCTCRGRVRAIRSSMGPLPSIQGRLRSLYKSSLM